MNQNSIESVRMPPLNLSTADYQRLFESKVTCDVNVEIFLLANAPISILDKQLVQSITMCVKTAVKMLMQYDLFAKEFQPINVTIVDANITYGEWVQPKGLKKTRRETSKDIRSIIQIVVAFRNASESMTPEVALGLINAMYWIDNMAIRTGSYDPRMHTDHIMCVNESIAYRKSVSNLYQNGFGVWSKDLIPFRSALITFVRSILDAKPYLEQMRRALSSGLEFIPQFR
ncbi:MAG: hypothetical protein IPK53_12025 [bacterium]|nr:hypothetical protein [bacterium]